MIKNKNIIFQTLEIEKVNLIWITKKMKN